MATADRLRALPTVLTLRQWGLVVVLTGARLLILPPEGQGPGWFSWLVAVLVTSFVLVFVGSRLWPLIAG